MNMIMEGFGPKKLAFAALFASLFSVSVAEAQSLSMEDMVSKAKKYELSLAHEASAKGQKQIMNGTTAYSYTTADSTDATFVYGNGETSDPTAAYLMSKGGTFYYDTKGNGTAGVKYSDHRTQAAKTPDERRHAFMQALLAAEGTDEDLRTQMPLAGQTGNNFVFIDVRDELVKVYDSKHAEPMAMESNNEQNQSFKKSVQKNFTDLLEKAAEKPTP